MPPLGWRADSKPTRSCPTCAVAARIRSSIIGAEYFQRERFEQGPQHGEAGGDDRDIGFHSGPNGGFGVGLGDVGRGQMP